MNWKDKSVLITGACGSVGLVLIDRLLNLGVDRVVALDHAETSIYDLDQAYRENNSVEVLVGDVRNRDSLLRGMLGIDVVFHGAALKHVNLGEMTPDEIVLTNIYGVQNVIHAAKHANVERVIFMSSDKAVNPTNVMGTSKLMGERLISAASFNTKGPIFSSTRFGNVLGSNGSVVPTFMKQIASNANLTLTDERMTRFVMTQDDAANLLISAAERAEGGEVFVTKMAVMRISDLAQGMVDLYAPKAGRDPSSVQINIVGKRPGEKFYEELMSGEETSRVFETEDFFVIHPAIRRSDSNPVEFSHGVDEYRSDMQVAFSLDQVKEYLVENRILGNFV